MSLALSSSAAFSLSSANAASSSALALSPASSSCLSFSDCWASWIACSASISLPRRLSPCLSSASSPSFVALSRSASSSPHLSLASARSALAFSWRWDIVRSWCSSESRTSMWCSTSSSRDLILSDSLCPSSVSAPALSLASSRVLLDA